MKRGEANGNNAITLVSRDAFSLTVRIPEIDITQVHMGQKAEVRFDAEPGETIEGTVAFVAPIATQIDGVAYFEATIHFEAPPEWMRSGLNADVDIVTHEERDVLRVPKRFLVHEGDMHALLYPRGATTTKERVDVVFSGNDGFVGISGNVHEGDTIVAP
jgi:multidrug efflux pump subunit AcrA (membrane-fusion protein)